MIVQVSQRCLDYWDERGIVSPRGKPADGKGSERLYRYEDLLRLLVVKKLRACGLSLQKIQKAVRKLKERHPDKDPLLQHLFLSDGKDLHRLTHDPETVEDVLADGQLVFSVVVRKVEQELEKRICMKQNCFRRRGQRLAAAG